jgi:hypothetical protein
VGSGFCCKKVPCPFGAPDPSTGWCIHLAPWENDDLDVQRYRCGRHEYILTQPGWQSMPAFGAGCGATLFNGDRERVIPALVKRALKIYDETSPPIFGGVLSGLMDDEALLTRYPWAVRVERFEVERIAPKVTFLKPRAKWRPGPWMDEPDFVEWRTDGAPYPLLIVRGQMGALCGYVGVPEGHAFHRAMNRDDRADLGSLPEDITAGTMCTPLFTPTGEPPTCWWLGFHCGNLGQDIPAMDYTADAVYVDIATLRERVEALACALFSPVAKPQ